ncbi:MAG TPA: alkyl sulfatase dimerization domain-containing protein [Pararobbsia sp.]|jgi:alkyl sulfatase BDS1-like metallo-beta-lactamase superfamily hydrolase|nr:alkyl sulfatase dimerization domain-containing protein [Pararobbsia sp.]
MKTGRFGGHVAAAAAALMLSWPAMAAPDDATPATAAQNRQVQDMLPFGDTRDFDDARRGFIADLPASTIADASGRAVIDLGAYDFLKTDQAAPDTVNPSLWRQSQLLDIRGLFKVVDGIYQVRNIDLANITFVRGRTGWIVIDPLTSVETARAALELVNAKVARLPVSAVIYTHSHVDHFAGVRGIVDEKDVRSGKIPVIAPAGFMEEAVSENVFAGNAMSRRASYMYGNLLPKGPKGNVGGGLGITTAAGTMTLIEPSQYVTQTGQTLTIDGIEAVFLMAPGSEAPAEMLFYFPQYKALDLAENATHTLHNLLTPRGAKVRDARKWSAYLDEVIKLWGDKADVSFGSHHWPQWGSARIVDHLEKQRDLYKYINDQTLRMINRGKSMHEIAETFTLPDSLARTFANRGYYGNLKHDVRATYQLYQGWWDGDPATYDPYPVTEQATRYVALIGADTLLDGARDAYEKGDYRWSATLARHVLFADPANRAAREAEARALEQLGYQAESGPVRNVYLTGAQELRDGIRKTAVPNSASPDVIHAMTTEMFFDFLAMHLDGPRVGDRRYAFNVSFPDSHETYVLTVSNGVLNYEKGVERQDVDATIALDRATLDEVALGKIHLADLASNGKVKTSGHPEKFHEMLSYFDRFDFWFTIAEP